MGEHAISEGRIALENIRASARAFAEVIAELRALDGGVASTELAMLRRAEMPAVEGDVMGALSALTRAAAELLRHGRAMLEGHPRLALAARRLASDLCIASAVLQAIDRDGLTSTTQRVARKLG